MRVFPHISRPKRDLAQNSLQTSYNFVLINKKVFDAFTKKSAIQNTR